MNASSRLYSCYPAGTGRAILVLVLACLGGTVQTVDASLVLTEVSGDAMASVNFFGTSLPSASDSASFGPFGGAAVAEVGRTRAVQTGSGLNAVSAEGVLDDIPSFDLRAQTSIDQTVRNVGPLSEALAFQYVINGGELRLFNPRGSFEGLAATAAVSIFVIAPGFSGFLWDWGVTLRGSGSSVAAEIHGFAPIFDFEDPLGLGMPDVSEVTVAGNEAVLSIAPFTGFADLGQMGAGSMSLINYSMYASVSGPALNGAGGEASLGDPFDIMGSPGSMISIPGAVPVPEPELWMMMLLGLAGVLGAVRKRHSPKL
jgi:hypothetical protein